MSEQAGAVGDSSARNLEMVLEKRRFSFSRDFSPDRSTQLIEDALKAVEEAWSRYHSLEFTRREDRFQSGRIRFIQTRTDGGFYAVAEYMPPNLGRKAQIKVNVPINQQTDGLENFDTPELMAVKESLEAKGYKSNVYRTWLPPQASQN